MIMLFKNKKSKNEAPKYISVYYREYLDLLKDRAQLENVKSIVNKSASKYTAADCIEVIFAEQ